MKNMLIKLFPALAPDNAYFFLQGILCTLVLMIVLLILALIFWLILRRSKSVAGITMNTENGTLFVAASAVSDLIYSLDDNFPDFEIVRVRLIRDGKDFAVQVKVYYAASGQSMLALTETFQSLARERLKAAFGIENVSRIDLIVPKCHF